jgi:hypothetical protein
LPSEAGWSVEEVKQFQECEDDGKDVAQALREGKCHAVTDGTYKDNEGAAGFVTQGIQHKHQLLGCNRTPAREEEMTPYRAELGGAIGMLILVAEICAHHGVTEGKMILAFDCESANKTLWAEKDRRVHATDYDMVMECRRQIKALPVEVEIMWIRRHQDKVAGAVLDYWARQNVRMDARAKNYGRKWKGQVLGPNQLSTERWSITVNGLKHARFNKEEIYELRKEETSKIYWQRKHAITDQAWKDINW